MAIFTTISVVIWFSTGALGIFATLVYVFTMRVVLYDILSMAIIPTLSTSILFCNLCYFTHLDFCAFPGVRYHTITQLKQLGAKILSVLGWVTEKKIYFFRRIFFSSGKKFTFEKGNVILFNTFLNLNLFYLIVVNFL